MRALLLTFALLSIAFASDVIEFTDSDFDSKIADYEVMLVEFFAPWCGHCKKLAPEYEKAATALKRSQSPVSLAKVDCTANTGVCGKFGVSGYPTLKIFKNGDMIEDYNGPREADGIVKTMRSKAGPTYKVLESLEAAEGFLKTKEYAAIGFFKSDDGEEAKALKKVADKLSSSGIGFAITADADVLKKYNRNDDLVLFRPTIYQSKFEDNEIVFDGDVTKQMKVESWLKENVLGLCGERTSDNAGDFKKPLFVAYFDVDYSKNVKGTNYWRNRVMKVGKKIKDEGKNAYFAVSNKGDLRNELEEFGVSDTSSDKPIICAVDSRDRKFTMEAEFSMEALEQFVNDLLEGKLEPYLKSEPIPESNDEPVKVVVGKTFDEIVNDPERDVLVEFYAPWCGHCKSLAPKYDELAEKLKDEPEITIAKMDATANDVPKPFEVRGFPTIFFVPKNSKGNPKKYEGGREVDNFLKYLAKEATNDLKGYNRSGKKIKQKKSEL